MPPPSALLGARIRRAQSACIVALGASSVLVRPTEAGTSREHSAEWKIIAASQENLDKFGSLG